MPTDEQLREQFEADCLHIDEGQLARTEAGDYAIEWVHGTWIGYAIAYKARDAEVQALREALGRLLVATDQIERYDDTTDLIAAADRALW